MILVGWSRQNRIWFEYKSLCVKLTLLIVEYIAAWRKMSINKGTLVFWKIYRRIYNIPVLLLCKLCLVTSLLSFISVTCYLKIKWWDIAETKRWILLLRRFIVANLPKMSWSFPFVFTLRAYRSTAWGTVTNTAKMASSVVKWWLMLSWQPTWWPAFTCSQQTTCKLNTHISKRKK